eukprot:TRINITY_DN5438_c0_g1_i1.p1 TRINITY_DN5438_c0_g1~~TRINITY_DN5438_c0_g1_i1.p1  ORF type:complete len:134 (+),score=34.72 TRINITY_DN5438_c0_g1_i1:52-453(+)
MNVSTQNMNEEKRSLQSKIVESETVAKAEEKQLLQAKQKVRHLEEESESRMESLRLLNQRLVELQLVKEGDSKKIQLLSQQRSLLADSVKRIHEISNTTPKKPMGGMSSFQNTPERQSITEDVTAQKLPELPT